MEILEHLATCGSRLTLDALMTPYGENLGQSLRKLERSAARCTHDFSTHSRKTVSVTLSRMKRGRLVFSDGPKRKALWRITKKGKTHFKYPEPGELLPPKDGKTRIIMFDIPEERRAERNWLRKELVGCDYAPLQKSIFMGLRPLPKILLDELRERRLTPYVRIVGLENSPE